MYGYIFMYLFSFLTVSTEVGVYNFNVEIIYNIFIKLTSQDYSRIQNTRYKYSIKIIVFVFLWENKYKLKFANS